jgi:hypothetical protein
MPQRMDRTYQDRRDTPRYPTQHPVAGESADRRIGVQGVLRDLSAGGCRLDLDTRIPPGTMVEARSNIHGIGLRIRGEVVWAQETPAGVLHGLTLAGYGSEEDALFHRLYVGRLARRTPTTGAGE